MKKHKVYVYPKEVFRYSYARHLDSAVFISIESTPACVQSYMVEELEDTDNDHILPSSDRVLNLEFDDLTEDREYKGFLLRTITQDQAYTILQFIQSHLGLTDIVVHCKAGRSRSQAVGKFIVETWPELYEGANLLGTYNPTVVSKLRRALRYENYYIRDYTEERRLAKTLCGKWYEQGWMVACVDLLDDQPTWVYLREDGQLYPSMTEPVPLGDSEVPRPVYQGDIELDIQSLIMTKLYTHYQEQREEEDDHSLLQILTSQNRLIWISR